jgi:hypothetical protein
MASSPFHQWSSSGAPGADRSVKADIHRWSSAAVSAQSDRSIVREKQ